MNKYILSIDQGTSSTKSLVIDRDGVILAQGAEALHTAYLDNGWVEQDPESIYSNVLAAVRKCLDNLVENGHAISDVSSIGISNQRETFIVWNGRGEPLAPAVVWQCKRSVSICDELQKTGLNEKVHEKTGLLIDPYFSATKLIWLVRNRKNIAEAIAARDAFFGTVDTWLLYKMTAGASYQTDYTNASRTLLFNLNTLQWDEELLSAFGLKGIRLPGLQPSAAHFGNTSLNGILPHAIPIDAMIGDSHAAAFGEGCFESGTAKATMGTGCSILMNIGDRALPSNNGMVTTICWSMKGRVDYALEGVIVSCGATLEWLKKEWSMFTDNHEIDEMIAATEDNGGVYLVPAFSGMGAPFWNMNRKAGIYGLSFSSGKNHLVRAAAESVAYQVRAVIDAMQKDAGTPLQQLMVDGGLTASSFTMQYLADVVAKKILTIGTPNVSALGAAYLAGLQSGLFSSLEQIRSLQTSTRSIMPHQNEKAEAGYQQWLQLV